MLVKEAKLSPKMFNRDIPRQEIRLGLGEALLEAGQDNPRMVVLTADVKESTRVHLFAQSFPDRFFNCGVAEQAMITIASGLAAAGKIPVTSSYAIFTPGRVWEQIRTTICLNNTPVKIIGSHAGLSAGPDGGNHQALEDLALMRSLPKMVVLVPCDAQEVKQAIIEAVRTVKPVYIRSLKGETPVITTPKTPFKIGKMLTFWTSRNPQVGIIACGVQVYEALLAAKELEKKGLEVMVANASSIKPMDEQAVVRLAKTTGAVVTVEEHQVNGGLGSAVAEILGDKFPVPVERVGIRDAFGDTGQPEELRKMYGLTKEGIIEAVKRVLARKQVDR